ncbi:hypothetical protein [Luteibacter sp. Sphag1AF]|uniref:hypothetical protein n=1 Tax=Luteibacter sp. Sphag1AF TaxID=2587031 RepID=UPI0016223438|nr:hypothetical protein [Luteibacter sp. Sphag1AF]
MTILDDIRQQYPQYADVPDGKLAAAIRQKYYADVPAPDFYRKAGLGHLVGLDDAPANGLGTDSQNFGAGAGKAVADTWQGLKQAAIAVPAFIQRHSLGSQDAIPDAINPASIYDRLKQEQQ